MLDVLSPEEFDELSIRSVHKKMGKTISSIKSRDEMQMLISAAINLSENNLRAIDELRMSGHGWLDITSSSPYRLPLQSSISVSEPQAQLSTERQTASERTDAAFQELRLAHAEDAERLVRLIEVLLGELEMLSRERLVRLEQSAPRARHGAPTHAAV